MSINTVLQSTYDNQARMLLQQDESKFQGTCEQDSGVMEEKFYNQSTAFEVSEKQSGVNNTNNIRPEFERRRLITTPFNVAPIYTTQEEVRAAIDIGSSHMRSMNAAFARKRDKVKIDALLGTAYTGKAGTTATTLPSAQTIAVDYVESGSTADSNLTIAKLRQTRTLFDLAEMDTERLAAEGKLYFAAAPSQRQALLRTTDVTSSDFNTVKALVDGNVDSFMGFKFIWSTQLSEVAATNVRSCIAWSWDALMFATGKEVHRVDERPDKEYAHQLYSEVEYGAVRMEEEKVIEILCDEDL